MQQMCKNFLSSSSLMGHSPIFLNASGLLQSEKAHWLLAMGLWAFSTCEGN